MAPTLLFNRQQTSRKWHKKTSSNTLISCRSAFIALTSAERGFKACSQTFSLNAVSLTDTASALEWNKLSELRTDFISYCRLNTCSCNLSVSSSNSDIFEQTQAPHSITNCPTVLLINATIFYDNKQYNCTISESVPKLMEIANCVLCKKTKTKINE